MSFWLSGRAFETKLNVLLGRLLSRELGMRAVSEYISRRDRPDVVIYINGIKIVLEGSYSRADAENDVKRRIQEGFGDLGIALHYKESLSQNLADAELEERLKASLFEVKVMVPEDVSDTLLAYFTRQKTLPRWTTGWVEARIQDLVSIINEAIQFVISEEDIKEAIIEIEQKINDFVLRAKGVDVNKKLAEELYNLFYKLYGLSIGDYERIDELLYAKAALTILLSTTFYQSVRAEIGLESVSRLCRQYGYRLGLKNAFEEILKVDYRPVYDLAIQVIETMPDALNHAIRELVELAEKCSSKRTLLRRDFSGKIYHKIVGDWAIRKNFATYFTTVPAAYLLAYLSVFTKTGVFSGFKKVKTGDLACGSGTLLTAAYSALKDLYIYTSFKEGELDLKGFHRLMLEKSLWGIDALRYAVQIASTNLALQDPTTQVGRMNTFTVPLGVENKKVTLGSLEFVEGRGLPSIAMFFAEKPSLKFIEGAESASITGGEVVESIPEFDFIIMNPPFTRATGRGGKKGGELFGFIIDEAFRKVVTERYDEIRSKISCELRNVGKKYNRIFKDLGKELFDIGQAGEGLLFLYLASKLVKNDGKIAFVLPKSLLSGTNWFLARCLLLEKFHLEHVVLSFDAENGYNFSESTSLSEALIVARKRKKPDKNEETKITVLLRKPLTSLEARALAFKITGAEKTDYIEVDGSKAYVYTFSRNDLAENLDNWGKLCAFPSHNLNRITAEIFTGKLCGKKLPITLLGKIADVVGLAVRRGTFHEVFKQVSEGTPEAVPAIIGGEEELRKRIALKPNAQVVCTKPKYLHTASKFLVPDRIWVDTSHALALYCNDEVVCNMFFGLKPKKGIKLTENMLKALVLWFNTTWGVLSILANRIETRGRWIELTITKWRLQPVLDVTRLDRETIKKLVDVFEKNSEKELKRLPEQFNPQNIDPVRKSIDEVFLSALGIKIDDKELADIYGLVYQNLKAWMGV
ncbi:MAG: hypothetical protein QXX08_10385 [Candidatus Bathyarchaeia archaeon]